MKDIKGREWLFRFTARTVRELAAETGLNTKELTGDNSLLQRVGKDESTLCTVMWVTIRPQAQALGVTEDDWFESLDAEGLNQAATEWVEAYINFSQPARREVLMRTLRATQARQTKAEKEVQAVLDNGEIDRVLDRVLSNLSPNSTITAAN